LRTLNVQQRTRCESLTTLHCAGHGEPPCRGQTDQPQTTQTQSPLLLSLKINNEPHNHHRQARDPTRYVNKQRTLVFSSRGITHRDRHLMSDIQDLLPHSKKDVKMDSKDKLFVVNEIAEMKDCNNTIFFEARKKKDLYMWVSRCPNGPSAKFLVQNIHTMAEVKLTGNCLKGSRPLLIFDKNFDDKPHLSLLKQLFGQVFGSPKGHPKVKPFIDHVLSFNVVDGRIWFRNYQIVYDSSDELDAKGKPTGKKQPVLVEIGPRFVLNPVRIFEGSFGGATLWSNAKYVSPNTARAVLKRKRADKYTERVASKDKRVKYLEANAPVNDANAKLESFSEAFRPENQ
jgi:ribosome biogenesis protein BRX1